MTNDLQVSDEIMSQILGMPENGDLTFGENNQETMSHLDGISDIIAGSQQGTGEEEMVMPTKYYGKPEPQIDWFIGEQGKEPPITDVPDTADGKEAASQSDIPAPMRILEPLSVGNRLYYMRTQMMSALKKKWEDNKAKYITIGALVVLAITALAIVTGGAIFGLIPPALQIFAAFMAGQALVKAGGFFSDYLTEGWAGKIAQGGKNLARAIGILLVELIFILLFDLSALLQVLKGGAKGAINMAREGIRATKDAIVIATKATGKGLLKTGTKVVTGVKGIGKGIGKGAKTLDDFAKRMLKKGRFKGFKITRKGKWFQLYASVNPWVLLASGEIVEVKNKGGVKVGQKGEKFITSGYKNADGVLVDVGKEVDGILVGGTKKQSGFVKNLDVAKDASKETTEKALKKGDEMFKKLEDQIKNSTDKIARINKGVPRNSMFRKNYFKFLEKQGIFLSKNAKKFLAIHHVVPNFLKGVDKINELLKAIGHDIDEVINAIGLPKIDISLLDDVIKNIESAISSGKNLDELGELTKFVDEIKSTLKLDDDINLIKLGELLEELKSFKNSAIHGVGSYHPRFNNTMRSEFKRFINDFELLIKSGLKKDEALGIIKPEIDNFIKNTITDLSDGTIKIIE